MNNFHVHYALQACDVSSFQGQKRFASDNRTEISKKCIKSFLLSVKHCSTQYPDSSHHIAIIDDQCSKELKSFINLHSEEFTSNNIKIDVLRYDEPFGIRKSIETCYNWLQKNGKDLVYQIQDDYLFTEKAVCDIIDMYFQMKIETNSESIISPYNDPYSWLTQYRNRPTPRAVIVGKNGYWIQYYDMSCSFLTSHDQFSQHWDLYNTFFNLVDQKKEGLESYSLNHILTQRGILGLIPINSLAFHLQTELEKDPHIDYRPLWDSIET